MVEKDNILKPALEEERNKPTGDSSAKEDENRKNNSNNRAGINQQQQQDSTLKIKKGLRIKLDCEFCKGPITSNPHVFRFANHERFFCCTGCMSGYKQKYAGRIESIKRKFAGSK
jgi:Lrp/AsnC family leucine-responsive transcriptional regulator